MSPLNFSWEAKQRGRNRLFFLFWTYLLPSCHSSCNLNFPKTKLLICFDELEWYDLISAVLNVAQTHWFQYKISNIWELSPIPKPKLVAWPDLASICYFPNFVTFHFYCHPISFACQNLNNYWLCYTNILAWQNFASIRQPSFFFFQTAMLWSS